MLPLYAQIPRDSFEKADSAHSGLLFDRFPDGWDERNYYKPADNTKKQFLERVKNSYKTKTDAPLSINLTNALNRQRDLVNYLQGESLIASTDWRFVSGLGAAHPYETGFIWHRTLSVPYLPGSSVKGMIRAWAEQWAEPSDQAAVTRLFGTEKTKKEEAHCGTLIVFDALPSKPPELEIDILNSHYSEYYQNPSNPPADYLSPIPVFFLTVAPNQNFEFFLALRKTDSEQTSQDLGTGLRLLQEAFETLGAGGKTAVGYGAFKKSQEIQKKCGAEFRSEQAAKEASKRSEQERLDKLSPLERELKIELEDFLKTVSVQEWDTRLLKKLEERSWTGEKAKHVAEKIKHLMENAGKWHPDFTGSNQQKLKFKERSLKVLKYLND